jgi:hypothetical protein
MGKLVAKIPNRSNPILVAQVEARWKKVLVNIQSFTEEVQLFRLRFQVLALLVQ